MDTDEADLLLEKQQCRDDEDNLRQYYDICFSSTFI